MLAVVNRAYGAGLTLFDTIKKIVKDRTTDSEMQKKVIKFFNSVFDRFVRSSLVRSFAHIK